MKFTAFPFPAAIYSYMFFLTMVGMFLTVTAGTIPKIAPMAVDGSGITPGM